MSSWPLRVRRRVGFGVLSVSRDADRKGFEVWGEDVF
jgi:hypothetical protein